jgi:hypothetical protein
VHHGGLFAGEQSQDDAAAVATRDVASICDGSERLTMAEAKREEEEVPPDMSLEDITDGFNDRGIPAAKFIEDIEQFSESFAPAASAELLIGAYTQLHAKYKSSEAGLQSRGTCEWGSTVENMK